MYVFLESPLLSFDNQIPSVGFQPKKSSIRGIELISIDRILNHDNQFDHHPERPHQLKFYNIIYFTGGNSKHLVDFEYFPVKAGTAVYLSKDMVNAFSFTEGMSGYCLIFTQEYLEACFGRISENVSSQLFNHQLYEPVVQIPESARFEDYLNLIGHELQKDVDPERTFTINSLFSVVLTKVQSLRTSKSLTTQDKSKVKLVAQFSSLIQEEYGQSRNAEYFAKKLLISYKHLNLCCREVLDKTAKQVIDEYVILEAKRRLINTAVQSTEIAYQLGFEEPTNFTKYFKKLTGFTPRQFKLAHAQK